MLFSCIVLSALASKALAGVAAVADTSNTDNNYRPIANCKGVKFNVKGNANNFQTGNILASNSTYNLTQFLDGVIHSTIPVSGTETLAGWFCDPTTKNANNTKLQVFRGSFFTNRESWTALGGTDLTDPPTPAYQPESYSWFDYANKLGYPTLAIDSLGDGLSSRPDGLLLAQLPYDISLYHDLVGQIRSGTTGQLPKKYSTLFHIGNSIGSTTGNMMAAAYPEDFDAYVLTGFSKLVQPSLPGVSLNLPLPAVLADPVRFLGLPLDYVTSSVELALTNSFFGNPSYVDYDPAIADLFFKRRDVISLGYVLSTYLPSAPVAAAYKGRVLTLTGEQDVAYCGLGSALIEPNASCGSLLKDTGSLFPAADYNYQSIPRTGHAIILHKSSQNTFKVAHDFLAGAKFGA